MHQILSCIEKNEWKGIYYFIIDAKPRLGSEFGVFVWTQMSCFCFVGSASMARLSPDGRLCRVKRNLVMNCHIWSHHRITWTQRLALGCVARRRMHFSVETFFSMFASSCLIFDVITHAFIGIHAMTIFAIVGALSAAAMTTTSLSHPRLNGSIRCLRWRINSLQE